MGLISGLLCLPVTGPVRAFRFLIERLHDEAVFALGEAQAGRLVFNYVGPLPPYSFINLAFGPEG